MGRTRWLFGGTVALVAVVLALVALSANNHDQRTRERPTPMESTAQPTPMETTARQRTQDLAAQADLRTALATALTFYYDADSFSGFGPRTAGRIDPWLVWATDQPAAPGVVSINLASYNELVMSTMSRSGQPFCISNYGAGSGADTHLGRQDAAGATFVGACSGGW